MQEIEVNRLFNKLFKFQVPSQEKIFADTTQRGLNNKPLVGNRVHAYEVDSAKAYMFHVQSSAPKHV